MTEEWCRGEGLALVDKQDGRYKTGRRWVEVSEASPLAGTERARVSLFCVSDQVRGMVRACLASPERPRELCRSQTPCSESRKVLLFSVELLGDPCHHPHSLMASHSLSCELLRIP